jgi:hypothetical protein
MNDPISSTSSSRLDRSPDLQDPDRITQPATRVVVPPPPPTIPELPDVDTAFVANAVKAATAGAPHMVLAMGVQVNDVECAARTPLQERLDAFMDSATPTFHTKDGDLQVGIPFRMKPRDASFFSQTSREAQPFIRQERIALANHGELVKIASTVGLSGKPLNDVASGRGTPDDIRRVTQALINANKLPPGPFKEAGARIRTMMCNYGIGLDCAGYVQHAFLASRDVSRSQLGFDVPVNEDLSGLATRGFKRVDASQVQAGDLFILNGPGDGQVGHTMIVRGSRMATVEEARALAAQNRTWGSRDASRVQRFELDSSWGNFADAQAGGVQRQIFWRDTTSGEWMNAAWQVEPKDKPYLGHPIDGFYRPSQEP